MGRGLGGQWAVRHIRKAGIVRAALVDKSAPQLLVQPVQAAQHGRMTL